MRTPIAKTATHICCLKTGDRFYLKSDPRKQVWQVRYHTMIKLKGQFKKLSVCKTDTGDERRFDANRVVFFLRRTIADRVKTPDYSIDKFFI